MTVTNSILNERSQAQKAKIIYSDSKHTNDSPRQDVFGEINSL